jgi:hypothetical protein
MDPKNPVRADHRYLLKVIQTTLGGKVLEIPSEFSRVSRVFCKAGGSWGRVFNGSIDDITLLKKVVKIAFKKGYLTKKEPWAEVHGKK